MQKFRGLTVLGVIAVAGCDLSTDLPTSQRIGFITVTQSGSGDEATLRPVGQFFQTSPNIFVPIANTAIANDTCSVEDYSGPPEQRPPTKVADLNAGASIAVTTDKAEASMVPVVNSAGSVVYQVPTGPIPFTPGSQIKFEVPGDSGGFPAQSLTTNTLVAPTFTPIERHPTDDLHLSWAPGGNTGGAIQLEFLYSSDSSLTPDKLLICVLRDDGSSDIPERTVSDWAKSPDDAQSVTGFRAHTLLQQKQDVLMDVIVQVEINAPTFTSEAAAENVSVSGSR